jgi:hypothetical protein
MFLAALRAPAVRASLIFLVCVSVYMCCLSMFVCVLYVYVYACMRVIRVYVCVCVCMHACMHVFMRVRSLF